MCTKLMVYTLGGSCVERLAYSKQHLPVENKAMIAVMVQGALRRCDWIDHTLFRSEHAGNQNAFGGAYLEFAGPNICAHA